MLLLNSIVSVLDHYTEVSVLDSIVNILNRQAQDELQGKLLDKQRCVTRILHNASPPYCTMHPPSVLCRASVKQLGRMVLRALQTGLASSICTSPRPLTSLAAR